MNGSSCIFAKTPINFVDRSSFAYHGIVASTAKVAIISSSTHFLFDFRIFTPYWCFALHFALLIEWNSSRLLPQSKHIQCKSSHSPNREKLINILIRKIKVRISYNFHHRSNHHVFRHRMHLLWPHNECHEEIERAQMEMHQISCLRQCSNDKTK